MAHVALVTKRHAYHRSAQSKPTGRHCSEFGTKGRSCGRVWVTDSAGLGRGFFRRCGSRILRGCWDEMARGSAVYGLECGGVWGVAWDGAPVFPGGPARVSSMLSQILSGGV